MAVDIDRSLLERHVIKLSPTPSDHLQKRSTPLNIKVFKGSVADTNVCLQGADAVIAIELLVAKYLISHPTFNNTFRLNFPTVNFNTTPQFS